MAVIIKGKNARKPHTVRYEGPHECKPLRTHANGRQVGCFPGCTRKTDQREQSFRTLADARAFKREVEYKMDQGTFVDPRAAQETFQAAAERMIADQPNDNTRELYRTCLRLHLACLAGRPLRAVAMDRDAVKSLCINHLQGRRMLAIIRKTCDEAQKSGRLDGHRLAGLTANHSSGRRDFIPHSGAQISAMAESMGADGLACLIMRETGMRIAEVFALRRSDFVQSISGTWKVRVERQRHRSGKIAYLKSHRDGRMIPVPAYLAALVCQRPDGDLFTITYDKFLRRYKKAARGVCLPAKFSPHQQRHSYATRLLENNVPITTVAQFLGDDIRTVANTYAHVLPSQDELVLSVLEEAA